MNNPKVLLADEPTGNVDSKTAKVILYLFKNISKDILVIVVSHNESDSLKYSDRLIELTDGQVIRDEKRVEDYQNDLIISNEEVVLPFNRSSSDEELKKFSSINCNHVNFKQHSSVFFQTNLEDENSDEIYFHSQKMENMANIV